MQNGVPRILLIRLSAIGDVVRVLPALHAIRSRYPQAQIDWVVERKSQDVLLDHPALDNVLLFERPEDLRESVKAFALLCNEVRRRRYDIVVDFHGILKSGMLMFASRASRRVGFRAPRAQEGSHWFATRRVALPHQRMNRMEENLLLAAELEATAADLEVTISIPDEVEDEVSEWVDAAFDSGKYLIAMHAPVDRPEKQWPLGHYAELADLLMADGRFEVVLTWGPGQHAVAERVSELSRRKPLVCPELTTLRHFAALCVYSAAYVGGDTGPMHIASAMNTPVVAIFGGTDPGKHSPLRAPLSVLYQGPESWQEPALEEARARLTAVSPEMAYQACVRVVHEGAAVLG